MAALFPGTHPHAFCTALGHFLLLLFRSLLTPARVGVTTAIMAKSATPKNAKNASNATRSSVRTRSQSVQCPKNAKPIAEPQAAQVILQKPPAAILKRVTKTTQSTPQQLNCEQSIQIVQTWLHGCLSSVLYLRGIFPKNCYETRYCINNSDQWTYKDYLDARQGTIHGDSVGGAVLALKRNISARVDRFLDLLVGISRLSCD